MRRRSDNRLYIVVFAVAIFFGGAVIASGQNLPVSEEKKMPARPSRLFEELGLTTDQVQRIRAINQERRPIIQAAQQRWKAAQRRLDEVIYAPEATEEQIKELTRVAQSAQGELLKERTITEFRIRQVMTNEQMVRFRELRERLQNRVAERAEQFRSNQPAKQRPIERLRQRNPQPKP